MGRSTSGRSPVNARRASVTAQLSKLAFSHRSHDTAIHGPPGYEHPAAGKESEYPALDVESQPQLPDGDDDTLATPFDFNEAVWGDGST